MLHASCFRCILQISTTFLVLKLDGNGLVHTEEDNIKKDNFKSSIKGDSAVNILQIAYAPEELKILVEFLWIVMIIQGLKANLEEFIRFSIQLFTIQRWVLNEWLKSIQTYSEKFWVGEVLSIWKEEISLFRKIFTSEVTKSSKVNIIHGGKLECGSAQPSLLFTLSILKGSITNCWSVLTIYFCLHY